MSQADKIKSLELYKRDLIEECENLRKQLRKANERADEYERKWEEVNKMYNNLTYNKGNEHDMNWSYGEKMEYD